MEKDKIMTKILDERNRPWVTRRPITYRVPRDAEQQIRHEVASMYTADWEVQDFLLPLPFATAPLWLKRADYVCEPADYTFSICCVCEREFGADVETARLVLAITAARSSETGDMEFFWRPRLSCCHQVTYGVSRYGCILAVDHALKKVLNDGMAGFRPFEPPDPSRECPVCETTDVPCENEICAHLLRLAQQPASLEEEMHRLVRHFYNTELDVVSPLAATAMYYACPECGRSAKNSTVTCKTCRRVTYCSKACRRAHYLWHTRRQGCLEFFKIWSW